MVKRNLAKVETAGSSPVVRSKVRRVDDLCGGLAKRLGSGLQSRIDEFDSRTHLEVRRFSFYHHNRAVGAVVAHFPDTEGVTSSNLVSPTKVEAIRLDITEEPNIRAIGAAASALRSHRRGRRFDSYIAHPRFTLVGHVAASVFS